MSAALRFPLPLGAAGVRMNAREYFALGETGERYELIDGVLVMSPSPTMPHQDLVRALLRQLEPQIEEVRGARLLVDTDIKFAEDTIYRPDLGVYLPGRLPDDVEYPLVPPDLLIEVVSPSSLARDLVTKRDDYARFGVREYWVVDPRTSSLRMFRAARRSRAYARPMLVRANASSVSVPGLVLDVARLFDDAARMRKGPQSPPSRRRPRP